MLQEATRSLGKSAPAAKGSVACVLVEQVDVKDGTEVIGLVHLSFFASPQVYKVTVMGSSVGSVTHNEKFTFPSPSVSKRAQASSELLPETLVSSQFHVTVSDVGSPEVSTQRFVRSFCPGSSFDPAVSLVQVSTVSAEENEISATARANTDASNRTRKIRERDCVSIPDLFLPR